MRKKLRQAVPGSETDSIAEGPRGGGTDSAYVRAFPAKNAYRVTVDRAPMLAWLQTVPLAVRPTALSGIYPRIVKKIMCLWTQPQALQDYMDEMTTDRRGGRLGFPPKVADEIERLASYIRLAGSSRPPD